MLRLKESRISIEMGRSLRYNLRFVGLLDGNDFPSDIFSSIILGDDIAGASNFLRSQRRQGMDLSNRLDRGRGIQQGGHFSLQIKLTAQSCKL
jgi:hypothetical protein